MKKQKQNGYVLLLAVLISSIILAMSMGVFAISLKEVALATFARDSVRAFAAASRGLECAMFADRINDNNAISYGLASNFYSARNPTTVYTPFVKGSAQKFGDNGETWAPPPAFSCGGVVVNPAPTETIVGSEEGDANFSLDFGDSCAVINVHKLKILTTFTSNGYSDKCNSTNPRRTQRTIAVSVNI
jgi:hypothetical protein